MTSPYTREQFNAQRAKAKAVSTALGRLTATVAVTLGLGQLAFIRLLSHRIAESKRMPLEASLFGAYIIVVGFLVWRMDRAVTAERIRCPQCRKVLKAGHEDVAAATGKCAHCGGDVIATTSPQLK
jgi:hypothetical protein